MNLCPRCDQQLAKQKTSKGFFFECDKCRGRAIGFAVIRKVVDQRAANNVWQKAARGESSPGVKCPSCRRAMAEVSVAGKESKIKLDICRACQFLWLDPNELEQMPGRSKPEPKQDQLPDKVREHLAVMDIKIAESQNRGDGFGDETPDEAWQWIPALLGMPVEHDGPALKSRPWATWAVAAVLVFVACVTFGNLWNIVEQFGLIPAQAMRLGGITLLTSFFLHAGPMHLIGNTYFLLVFGDNVEDHLGRLRFIFLLLVATIVGGVCHILADPNSTIPCVGASGGISGIIVYYALQFPRAQLGIMWRIYFYFRWARFPAWAGLLFWVFMQLVLAFEQLAGVSNVSALAHLGGALVGFGAWVLWRNL